MPLSAVCGCGGVRHPGKSIGLPAKTPSSNLSMGNVAVVFALYEMFNINGLAIKARFPYETTIVSTCAMGSVGYIWAEAAITSLTALTLNSVRARQKNWQTAKLLF